MVEVSTVVISYIDPAMFAIAVNLSSFNVQAMLTIAMDTGQFLIRTDKPKLKQKIVGWMQP